jgi:phospholipase A1
MATTTQDIEKYMGHFEFRSTYRTDNHELSMMLRNNLRSENHGAVQLDWTFPIWRGLSGHAQVLQWVLVRA